jgi:FKBP-type peptidyl-prolyl cis-trans isomerase
VKKIFVLLSLLVFISGCSKKPEVVKTPSGLKYVDNKIGSGFSVKNGDIVTLKFTVWVVKDSSDLFGNWDDDKTKEGEIVVSEKSNNPPMKFVLGGGMFIHGGDEGIVGMKVGGIRTIIIPSYLAYGKDKVGPIPPNSTLRLKVTLVDAKHQTLNKQWVFDSTEVKKTKDGLKYVILSKGTGPKPVDGQLVVINYSGYLTNGIKFESTLDNGEAVAFKLGQKQVIPGLDEGVRFLNKGAKAKLFIPPSLAYGAKGIGKIPPNATLIFDVDVVDIKK